MPRDRDDDFDIADYGNRLARANAGPRPCLTVPEGLKFYKPPETAFTIDIVPYRISERINKFHENCRFAPAGKLYPEQTFFVHRVGVNNDSLTCPAATFGLPCPVCKDAAQYRNRPDSEARKAASDLRASAQQLFLVYDHDQKDRGLQLWHISQFCFGKQLDAYIGSVRQSARDKVRLYFHPTRGMSIRAFSTKESMDGGKKYNKFGINEIFDRERPLPDEVIRHNYCLTDMVRLLDYKQLEAIYRGEVVEDADEAKPGDRDERDEPRRKPEEYRLTDDKGEDEPPPAKQEERREVPKREEPRKAPPKPESRDGDEPPCATRDVIRFEYRQEVFEGTVVKIDEDKRLLHVKCDDRENPRVVDYTDLVKVLTRDTVFDQKPAKTAAKPAGGDDWDDDPDESRVPTKTAAKGKAKPREDDASGDEEPPAARKRK